jgi:hypothetical protein
VHSSVFVQDFVCTDRGISGDLVPRFGDLLQLPLFGQPLALVYNIDGLDESSPNLVRPSPLGIVP